VPVLGVAASRRLERYTGRPFLIIIFCDPKIMCARPGGFRSVFVVDTNGNLNYRYVKYLPGGRKYWGKKMGYAVTDSCICCGACEEECPMEAISKTNDRFEIDTGLCTECGLCLDVCPVEDGIVKTD